MTPDGARPPPPDLSSLPPLRAVIAAHELSARKALGQHFLLDLNLTRRIARAAGPLDGADVIEIGAGPGGLTRALLEAGARVAAVERDPRCARALAGLLRAAPDRLRVVEADARALDIRRLAPVPRRVVANLPYGAATVLLGKWLDALAEDPAFAAGFTLMFQREVARRITAPPGGAARGRLGVYAQWLCEASILFDVAPRAFAPPPKVTSTVIRLVPRPAPLFAADARDLRRVTAAAFGQRRKMLRSSLKTLGAETEALLAAAGVDGSARAETLGLAGYCRLANALSRIEGRRRSGSCSHNAPGAGARPPVSPPHRRPRARCRR